MEAGAGHCHRLAREVRAWWRTFVVAVLVRWRTIAVDVLSIGSSGTQAVQARCAGAPLVSHAA